MYNHSAKKKVNKYKHFERNQAQKNSSLLNEPRMWIDMMLIYHHQLDTYKNSNTTVQGLLPKILIFRIFPLSAN